VFIRVEEVIEQDEWQSQHGPMWGWKVRALDLATDEQVYIGLNSKPGNVLTVGTEFEFTPNGKTVGVYRSGKREQAGNRPPAASTKAPAKPASGAANAATGHSHAAPTMSQSVAVFFDCATAIAEARAKLPEGDRDLLGPGQVTTLFLGRLDGRIVRNPTAAERAAEQAALQKQIDDAKALLAKSEKKDPDGYEPAPLPEDDSDIPF